MTEAELKSENFEKVFVLNEESDNGFDYYYYRKEFCEGLLLRSNDNLDVKDNEWSLGCDEIPAIKITSIKHYKYFKEILETILC